MVSTNIIKRVLLKLSGEALLGSYPFGISYEACLAIARPLLALYHSGIEVGIVIGAGNLFRGIHLEGMGVARTPADHLGMLGTLMNGIALQQAIESVGGKANVFSALECPRVAETYSWKKARTAISSGEIVIFVGGTGNPYFTTDTAAALRACEIEADALLKATKVDGVYSKDPQKYPDAIRYTEISYSQVLTEKLEVMDATSIALCRNNNIPILVFHMALFETGKILNVLSGDVQATRIHGK